MLHLQLLGQMTFSVGDTPITRFVSRRAPLLLIYLALTGKPQPRATLAALFWPETSASQAKKNLRDLLFSLRPLFGPYLDISHSAVAFRRDAPHEIDVLCFEHLASAPAAQVTIAQLQQMADLHRGEFLPDCFVDDAPGLDQWLRTKRAALHELAVQGLERLVERHLAEHDANAALAVAARLLALEPWRESAHRQRMLILARQGQRAAAIEQFELCRQVLAEELGVAPAPETLALVEAIKAGAAGTCVSPTPHNLPRSLTPFQGRAAELAQVTALLRNPDYPLVTLVGEGGVGKTRLALEIARQLLDDFPDGVWFVPLADVEPSATVEQTMDKLATEIGAAAGIAFQGVRTPAAYLASRLHDRAMLLVLDNFDQLAPHAPALTALLAQVADLRVLVTSRLPLHLQAEQLVPLKGLRAPGRQETVQRTGLAGLWEYSSVQLFVERARRVKPDFAWSRASADHVAVICRVLEGLPLGLELAASLLRERELPAVAAALQASYGVLTTSLRDVPPRHRSLQAVFDGSWALLTPERQGVLAACTVFHGEFSVAAASFITGATADDLASLAEAALLRPANAGRYAMHERVREFAAPHLTADDAVLERHSLYYLNWLADLQARLEADCTAPAAVHGELANIWVAWQYAVAHGAYAAIARSVEALSRYYAVSGPFGAAYELLTAAVTVLDDRSVTPDPARAVALGLVLVELAYFAETTGRTEEAMSAVSRAVQIGLDHSERQVEARAYHRLALLHYSAGDFNQCCAAGQKCLVLARQLGLPVLEARALVGLALASMLLDDFPAMHAYYAAAEPLIAATGQQYLAMNVAINLASYYDRVGNLPAMRTQYQRALTVSRAVGHADIHALALHGLGVIAASLGDSAEAMTLLQRALRLAEELGHRRQQSSIQAELAAMLIAQGRLQPALAAVERACRIAEDSNFHPHTEIARLRRGRTCARCASSLGPAPILMRCWPCTARLPPMTPRQNSDMP